MNEARGQGIAPGWRRALLAIFGGEPISGAIGASGGSDGLCLGDSRSAALVDGGLVGSASRGIGGDLLYPLNQLGRFLNCQRERTKLTSNGRWMFRYDIVPRRLGCRGN